MDLKITDKIFEQLHTCINLFSRSRQDLMPTSLMKEIGRGQGHVMSVLLEHDGLTPKELSNTLKIRAASLGELVDKLERSGYIRRQEHESDRRTFRVFLTDNGRTTALELIKIRENAMVSLFDGLSAEEQLTLSLLLDKLISSLHPADLDNDNVPTEEWEETSSGKEHLPGRNNFLNPEQLF